MSDKPTVGEMLDSLDENPDAYESVRPREEWRKWYEAQDAIRALIVREPKVQALIEALSFFMRRFPEPVNATDTSWPSDVEHIRESLAALEEK